jgi:hypothetical protein
MVSKPKRQNEVGRRSRGWGLVALTLVVGGLGAGQAWADIQVHVMNCTTDAVEAMAFDAKDSVRAVASSKKDFPINKSGESATLSCAGEGKGYCQMQIGVTDLPLACKSGDGNSLSSGHVGFHLDSGKWAVVTGFKQDGNNCQPVVTQNLDSAPASCK